MAARCQRAVLALERQRRDLADDAQAKEGRLEEPSAGNRRARSTDRENILSVIQSSYGTYDDFNRAVRGLFAERLDPNAVPSRSASSYRAPSGADASRRTASELGWPMV